MPKPIEAIFDQLQVFELTQGRYVEPVDLACLHRWPVERSSPDLIPMCCPHMSLFLRRPFRVRIWTWIFHIR